MRPTTEQLQIIHHEGGHAIVGAVAGSGKSAAMIERIAHLLEHGADPARILVLMFNKSARLDFEARLAKRLPGLSRPEVFTFHGFGMRLCRRLESFQLLESARLLTNPVECQHFGRAILMRLNERLAEIDRLDLSSEVVSDFLSAMDLLKGAMYDGSTTPEGFDFSPHFLTAYPLFEGARRRDGIRMFSDLIYDPVMLALNDIDVEHRIGNRYDHIILDEFQDINDVQMRMVQMVAGTRAAVMAVGDEDQTIYGWRGAKPEFMISQFEAIFPNVTRYTLTRTFRYGHSLSMMASFCISQNKGRTDKLCISALDKPTNVGVRMHTGDSGERVVEEIREWVAAGRRLDEIAILVREYSNAIPVEIALHRAGIPVRIVGAPSFVDWPEVFALRGYMQLACGGLEHLGDEDRLTRVVSTMLTIPTLYLRRGDVEHVAREIAAQPSRAKDLLARDLDRLSATNQGSLAQLRRSAVETIRWACNQPSTMRSDLFLLELERRTKLFEFFRRNASSQERFEEKCRMVRQVIALGRDGKHNVAGLNDLLAEMSLSVGGEDEDNRVLLTSVHRSKGSEWPFVMLPDLAEGFFPNANSPIEDERRLFYVAVTRAQEKLCLVSPVDRTLTEWAARHRCGHPDIGRIKASRFLYECNLNLSMALGANVSGPVPSPSGGTHEPAVATLVQRYRDAAYAQSAPVGVQE